MRRLISGFCTYPFVDPMYMAAISAAAEQTKQRTITTRLRRSRLDGRTARCRPTKVRVKLRRTATEIKMLSDMNAGPPWHGSRWCSTPRLVRPCATSRHVLQYRRSRQDVTTVTHRFMLRVRTNASFNSSSLSAHHQRSGREFPSRPFLFRMKVVDVRLKPTSMRE